MSHPKIGANGKRIAIIRTICVMPHLFPGLVTNEPEHREVERPEETVMETGSLRMAEVSSLRAEARNAVLQTFIKYIAVGGIAFVVDWGTLNLALWFGLHYM